MGKTGAGKSSSINTIVGENVCKVTSSSQSVTKHCQLVEKDARGKHLVIVDTPGLYDTESSEEETCNEIGKMIGLTSPGFHAFIVVIRIGRFTKEEIRSVHILAKMFGAEMYERTVLLFAGIDNLEADGVPFRKYLRDDITSDLQDLITKCAGRVVGFNNRNRNDNRQVDELMILVGTVDILKRGSYYTNDMYKQAKSIMEEEENRRLEEDKQKSRSVVRQEMRKDIVEGTNWGQQLLELLAGLIPVAIALAKIVIREVVDPDLEL